MRKCGRVRRLSPCLDQALFVEFVMIIIIIILWVGCGSYIITLKYRSNRFEPFFFVLLKLCGREESRSAETSLDEKFSFPPFYRIHLKILTIREKDKGKTTLQKKYIYIYIYICQNIHTPILAVHISLPNLPSPLP